MSKLTEGVKLLITWASLFRHPPPLWWLLCLPVYLSNLISHKDSYMYTNFSWLHHVKGRKSTQVLEVQDGSQTLSQPVLASHSSVHFIGFVKMGLYQYACVVWLSLKAIQQRTCLHNFHLLNFLSGQHGRVINSVVQEKEKKTSGLLGIHIFLLSYCFNYSMAKIIITLPCYLNCLLFYCWCNNTHITLQSKNFLVF